MIQYLKELIKKLYFLIKRLEGPSGFKHLGKQTIFRRPFRIIGKKNIFVGDHCDIMYGIRMEAVCEWNGKRMQPVPEITIQDYVTIGQNCHLTAARRIIIGEGSSIMPEVLITDIKHEDVINKSLCDTGIIVGSVTIGKYVQVGMGARIMANGKDVVIGDNAIIGANAVVTGNVEERTTVVGIPARKI